MHLDTISVDVDNTAVGGMTGGVTGAVVGALESGMGTSVEERGGVGGREGTRDSEDASIVTDSLHASKLLVDINSEIVENMGKGRGGNGGEGKGREGGGKVRGGGIQLLPAIGGWGGNISNLYNVLNTHTHTHTHTHAHTRHVVSRSRRVAEFLFIGCFAFGGYIVFAITSGRRSVVLQ